MVTSHAFSCTGDVITGDSNGSILVWTKNSEYVFKTNKEVSAGMKACHMVKKTICTSAYNNILHITKY